MQETLALLVQARGGDTAAYEDLFSAYAEALCGAILSRWSSAKSRPEALEGTGTGGGEPWGSSVARPSEEVAASWARQLWDKHKAEILRKPEEGGYAGKVEFHRWVIRECTSFGSFRSEDDLRSKLEVDWPRGEDGNPIELADQKQLTPEELVDECAKLAVLLEIVFLPETGYPHQQLSFVLGKYIHGKPGKQGYQCDSALVVKQYNHKTLGDLAQFIAGQCRCRDLDFADSPFSSGRVRWLEALEDRLRLILADLMASDGASLTQFQRMKARVVRSTRLEEYCPSGVSAPEDAVTWWCHKVGARLRHLLGPAWVKGEDAFWPDAEKQARKNST
jgi:hypothetical protein